MLIKVIYHDDKHDMVKPFLLDDLIDSKKVKMFCRSDGWAIIGYSPVRNRRKKVDGDDKRLQKGHNSLKGETRSSKKPDTAALTLANPKKQNCWEFMECGRAAGGKNVMEFGICPASTLRNLDGIHGGNNAGRACWVVAGTMCHGEPQGTFAKKTKACSRCKFYKLVRDEEEERVPTILLLELSQEEDIVTLDIS